MSGFTGIPQGGGYFISAPPPCMCPGLTLTSIQQNICSRLTPSISSIYSDPKYAAFSYDTLTNLSVNYQDKRIVLNRGLTASNDE